MKLVSLVVYVLPKLQYHIFLFRMSLHTSDWNYTHLPGIPHHIPNTPLNMVVRPRRGHIASPIVDVPLARGKHVCSVNVFLLPWMSRALICSATLQPMFPNDEDFVPGEYFDKLPSSNSNLQHPSTAAAINTEEHGSRSLCFCI
jgi:hypothetical protein